MEDWKSNNGTRPCPFGCESSIFRRVDVKGISYIRCEECGAHGPIRDTIEQAEIAWNQRIENE